MFVTNAKFAESFVALSCGGCGVRWAMEAEYYNRKTEEHTGFKCPNGCERVFCGETKAQKLEKELAAEKKRREWAESSRDSARKAEARATRSARAYRGVATKIRHRVGNGVCPCCRRTFQNLMRHMKTKHAKFRGKK